MASKILAEISRSDLADLSVPDARIAGFKQLASYNWLDKAEPTILVPGSPPLWSPPSAPQKLTPDSGVMHIDQNAARNPRFPLEPLFHALYVSNPDFDIRDIDLVTDRNNIRKLLRFVRGSSRDAFQIRAEIASNGRTALFTRVEANATETIRGFRGYGHSFEKAYTEVEHGSSAHHRIVGYDFGGMKCIVRHESDGYVDDNSPTEVANSLLDELKGLSISKPDDTGSNSSATTTVESGGRAVGSSSTLVIKTRAVGRELDMAEICCQLWASQTRRLVVAYHRDGVFDKVELRDMTSMVRQWEMASQADLGKLACLLAKIIGVARRSGDRGALVDYGGGARLRIISGNGSRALPEHFYVKWGVKEQGGVDDAQEDVAKLSKDGDEIAGVSGRQRPAEDATMPPAFPMPAGTLFAEHIEYSVRKGLRQFFRRMPARLSDYRALCGTLKSLPIDILAGRQVQDIMKDMRKGKSDWDPDEGGKIEGMKSLARDSAFRLLYLLLLADEEGKAVDQNQAYNAVLFVVSHRAIFKYRTRKMVREAFEDRFNVSYKQRQTLDKWPVEPQEEGSDVTTEDEGFDFDSDSDYYYSD